MSNFKPALQSRDQLVTIQPTIKLHRWSLRQCDPICFKATSKRWHWQRQESFTGALPWPWLINQSEIMIVARRNCRRWLNDYLTSEKLPGLHWQRFPKTNNRARNWMQSDPTSRSPTDEDKWPQIFHTIWGLMTAIPILLASKRDTERLNSCYFN